MIDRLTPRQRELMAHLANGRTWEEAAYAMGISRNTVRSFRQDITRRLGVADIVGVLIALGWLTPPPLPGNRTRSLEESAGSGSPEGAA